MKASHLLLLAWAVNLMLTVFLGSLAAAPESQQPTPIIDSTGADPKTLRAEGWHTPRPPYPFVARAKHEKGSMYVEIVTGADGRVLKASIPRSKDHPTLDLSTARWAYLKWSGPPHHKLIIPVTYVLN